MKQNKIIRNEDVKYFLQIKCLRSLRGSPNADHGRRVAMTNKRRKNVVRLRWFIPKELIISYRQCVWLYTERLNIFVSENKNEN